MISERNSLTLVRELSVRIATFCSGKYGVSFADKYANIKKKKIGLRK